MDAYNTKLKIVGAHDHTLLAIIWAWEALSEDEAMWPVVEAFCKNNTVSVFAGYLFSGGGDEWSEEFTEPALARLMSRGLRPGKKHSGDIESTHTPLFVRFVKALGYEDY